MNKAALSATTTIIAGGANLGRTIGGAPVAIMTTTMITTTGDRPAAGVAAGRAIRKAIRKPPGAAGKADVPMTIMTTGDHAAAIMMMTAPVAAVAVGMVIPKATRKLLAAA